MCACADTSWCVWEWVRGQPAGVAVLLTPYGSQRLNSGSHAWKQALYELQLSSQPPKSRYVFGKQNVSICLQGVFREQLIN